MSDNTENELKNADEMEGNVDFDDALDKDNDGGDDYGAEKEEETEDTLDSDEDSSATPSDGASDESSENAKQEDSSNNPVVEDASENNGGEKENAEEMAVNADFNNVSGENGETGNNGEDPSTTPLDEASDDRKQEGSEPDNPKAEDVAESHVEEKPAEEFTKEEPAEQSADVVEQPGEQDSQVPAPSIPPEQIKVKRVEREAVDSLMLDLTFETVRKTITLAELKSIKPGYTFLSQNPVNSPVEIRANGKLIGYGKLVSVDGNIGVQITEFI